MVEWSAVGDYTDIKYHKTEGIAKITINRPEVRNALRPLTIQEMMRAFEDARQDEEVGVIILTGEGEKAFCSGGDQRVRKEAGYAGDDGVHRLNVLDFQRQIRTCPKPVIAMVAGYSIGGGHVLHLVCDLTIAAENAIFGQTGPKVGSFDGGYGASYMARIIGQKKAREIWYLCRQYNAQQALDMGERERRHGVDDLLGQLHLGVAGGVGSAGDDHVGVAPLDLAHRIGDGLQAGGASPRHGDAVHPRRQPEIQGDLPRHVGRRAGEDDAPPDDGVDLLQRQLGALEQRGGRRHAEGDGVHLDEVAEGLHEGRADTVHDDRPAGLPADW